MVALGSAILQVRDRWRVHRLMLMWLAIIFMGVVAVPRLAYESWRLLSMSGSDGGHDLRNLSRVVQEWFAGKSTFLAGYPPASLVMLWPAVGWLNFEQARWLWGTSTIAVLALLGYWLIKASGADAPLERALWVMIMLSIYPIAITLGNGQLGIHLLVALIAGALLLVRQDRVAWRTDIFAAALWLLSLAKLNFSVPFLWILLFVPGRLRPILLTAIGYAALTLFGLTFQANPWTMLWNSFAGSIANTKLNTGEANLYYWMTALGWGDWRAAGSMVAAAALGAWTYRNRRADIWILLSVTAIVARIWMYHRMYDDVLILLPMAALFRIAKVDSTGIRGAVAGILFALGWMGLEMPGTLARLAFPQNLLYEVGQTAVWATMLVLLVNEPRAEPVRPGVRSPSSVII